MPESIPLHEIILETPPRCPLDDWARQLRSAQAINERFARGIDTVLLADEVGMGKSYVALAAMASYLFQTGQNDRKVLLITPPSSVLRVKWQQEIQSFNEHYLSPAAKARKGMQAVSISSYWDLFRNLKDFGNHNILRVEEETRLCFTWCMFNWAFSQGLLGKKRRIPWKSIAEIDAMRTRHPDIVNFLSHFSEQSICHFLEEDYSRRSHFYKGLFRSLNDGSFDESSSYNRSDVASLLKRFANEQDQHEPNVYIISMSALARPRIDESDNKLLSKYLLAHLLSGRHANTWKAHVKTLVQANILPDEFSDKHSHRWNYYVDDMKSLAGGEFFGMREAVIDQINTPEVQAEWHTQSDAIMHGESHGAQAFFNKLGNRVFTAQLARANIGFAVVDEVHNWKSGAFNAHTFREQFSPYIPRKLIMSATPFQMEEGEMERIFSFVQKSKGGSEEVMKSLYAPNGEVNHCLVASAAFGKAWQTLSSVPTEASRLWELFETASMGMVDAAAKRIMEDYAESDEMRHFAASLASYRLAIRTLQDRLGQVVIRHTKGREKRLFHIGEDFDQPCRTNHHNALYPAMGYASEGDALVNFIGMRLGQLVQREEKKSFEANARLLGGLTSSTKAFRESARHLGKTPATQAYRGMFEHILDRGMHPKVSATVERAFSNFVSGRKTLIFCERVATLKEIELELAKKIDGFISEHGDASATERRNLLKRRDLLENLWWHSLWDALGQRETGNDLLGRYLSDAQTFTVSCLAKVGVYPSARRIINLLDTWLIGRAATDGNLTDAVWKPALDFFSHMAHLLETECQQDSFPNLRDFLSPKRGAQGYDDDDDEDNSVTTQNDRNSITIAVEKIVQQQYSERRSLWQRVDSHDFHRLLWGLLISESAQLCQGHGHEVPEDQKNQEAMVFYDVLDDLMTGIRKFTLRDDLLVRYERVSQADNSFDRIADGLRTMRIGHDDSMLARVNRFLSILAEADGSISRADLTQSKRKSLWQGVSIGRVGNVATLDGNTHPSSRAGICAAFNSPLLPDVLICTSIGSEGIDLHRQCADVIHHDLPWNPAKLEQRNGRVDRVGSLAQMSDGLLINIGIPFLANNYEQYQYQKVYSRAQKFEILLGKPEFDLTDIDEEDLSDESGGKVREVRPTDVGNDVALRPLPQILVDSLRLDLTV